jgi:hypothetical protein
MRYKILLFVCLFCSAVWNTAGAYYERGNRVAAADVTAGMKVAIEAASDQTALTHYLCGNQIIASYMNDCVFELVSHPTADAETSGACFALKQVSTGLYMGKNFTMVSDIADAANFLIRSSSETTSTNSSKTAGWDATSCTFGYYESGVRYYMCNYWGSLGTVNKWSYTDTNAWNIYSVTEKDSPKDDLSLLVDYIEKTTGTSFTVGTYPGYYEASAVSAFTSAYNTAKASLDATHTDAEYTEYLNSLQTTWNSVKNATIAITDGYYRIVNTSADFTTNGRKSVVWYSIDDNHQIGWQRFDSQSPYQIFKVTKNGDYYDIQSLSSGEYVDAKETNVQTLTSGYRHQVFTLQGDGKYKIASTKDNVAYHPGGHSGGSGNQGALTTWGDVSDHGTWYLRPVSADSIEFYTQMKQIDVLMPVMEDSLANAIVVTKTGDGLITAASQLSSNAKESSEGSFEGLLDDNFDTYFHSSYSAGIGAYHYLQVNLNDNPVDHFMFYYKGRNSSANRDYPAWIRVYGSNDASSWTVVADIRSGFPTSSVEPANSDYYSSAIMMDQKYQYFRFEVRAKAVSGRLDPTGYPYFTLSAFQMYDYTIDEANSTYSYVPGMTDKYDALKSALADALASREAGTMTSEKASAALTAYDNFVDYSVPTHKVTIGTVGYATIGFNYNAVVPEGVKVYYATSMTSDKVVCTELTGGIIPARTPVLLHAAAGTYTFEPDWTSTVQEVTGNLFQASPNKVTTQQDGKTYYALTTKTGSTSEIVLKKLASGVTIPAGRVYIATDASASSKELLYFSFGEVSGIRSAVNAGNDRNIIYDLQGRRVNKPVKGIYIVNGKKVIVK